MVNQHTIEHSVFDMAFGSERDAFEQEGELGALVRGRLLQVVDEVFDEMSDTDSVLRIDTLEIDLGVMPYEGFQDVMEDRLREKLRDLLRQKMMTLGTARLPANEGIVTRGRLEIEQLEHFLSTGRLPWNASVGNGRTIDQLLLTAVDKDRARLVEYLQRSPRRNTIIQRLVSQFPDDVLTDFARMLAPSHARVMAGLLSAFNGMLTGGGIPQSRKREFGRVFRAALVDELLNASASTLSSRYLLRRILRRIASHRYGSHSLITMILASESRQGGAAAEVIRELAREFDAMPEGYLLTDADAPEKSVSDQSANDVESDGGISQLSADEPEQQSGASSVEILRERIARALISGDVREISPIWRTTILREHSDLLEEAVRHYGRQERTRRTIANEFPEPMLRDIVVLIEPNASDFIDEVVERPELFHHAIGQPTKTVGSVKRRLWEFTLTYLLVERGSRFNRRAYMGSLVRQMAAHENIRYDDLLNSLTKVLERMEVSSVLKRELLQILAELRDSRPVPQASDESDSQRLIASYDLYERLRSYLLGESPASHDTAIAVTQLIGELAGDHPEQLQTFLLEMRSGEIALERVKHSLQAGELEQLVKAFLSLGEGMSGTGTSRLAQAIESYARQAVNPRRYYGEILERIVHNQPIDFKAIIERKTLLTGAEAHGDELGTPEDSPAFEISSHRYLVGDVPEMRDEAQESTRAAHETRSVSPTPDDGDNVAFPAREESGLSISESTRSYDLYERLRERLVSGTPAVGIGAVEATQLIDDLEENYPEQLQTLLLEMRSGNVPLDRVESALSAAELEHLIKAFLSLIQQTGGHGTSDLARAIDSFARQAKDLRSYYGAILDGIVHDQLIDFEAIIEGSAPSPELRGQDESAARQAVDELLEASGTDNASHQSPEQFEAVHDSPTAQAKEEPAVSESTRSRDLYERLKARLVDVVSPNVIDATDSVTNLVDELAGKHPEQLQELLLEMRSGEIALERVVSVLAARELAHLIRAFLDSTQRRIGSDTTRLLLAIESNARQARDLRRYYGEILQRIVHDQLIDFEAIIGVNASLTATDMRDESGGEEINEVADESTPGQTRHDAADQLIDYLRSGGEITSHDAARLAHTVELMLARHPARLRNLLDSLVYNESFAERIASLLPERLLTRVLFFMRPADHHRMQRYADILANASYASDLDLRPGRIKRLKWQFILQYAVIDSQRFDERDFVRQYADFLAEELRASDTGVVRDTLARQVELNSLPSTRELHHAISNALMLAYEKRTAVDKGRVSESRRSSRRREPEEEEDRIEEEIYVYNAGMVIASPYMTRLFDMLGLTNGPAFKDRDAAERAVHLLQFMVNERTDTPEYELVLNKILCGVRTGTPIERRIDIDDNEKTIIESLINGMIQNWKTIGNTSIAGFRESFLQREGRLQLIDNAWHLIVVPKAFDMLLDQIPWSFSTIKHPWMERVVYVEWR